MKQALNGFKDFIARGNVVDLAVGVIIAGAFSSIVTALNESVLMPLIAAVFGKPNFDRIWTIHLNGATILPGTLITTGVNFLIIAGALYFFVVLPMGKLSKSKADDDAEPEQPVKTDEALLLTEIRDLLKQNQG
ncbi:large conductance mechanosensitive channel protein MscL [Trueperella bialowiezensis]|uniref:Large-conductance mechanosensitive channel n=1 Tax=Trueperella bialowiezensis TaxID=312285 RepID=A0A3S4YXG6_9ACTO|nr:large conductance mechanosensitive channel protein MscL [Trueperella bialowiezensis]VEI12970.1 Large-conductance mechanosensitive channel [Trueperella bialowiezensis]